MSSKQAIEAQIEGDGDAGDLDDAVELIVADIFATLEGPLIARVLEYDSGTERATVRPVVVQVVDGIRQPPVDIYNVKVEFPSGGGQPAKYALTIPIIPGDYVELTVMGEDHSTYLGGQQDGAAAPTPRRFSLADVTARPMRVAVLPVDAHAADGPVLYAAAGGFAYLGGTIGAQLIARADKTDAELAKVAAAFNGHLHNDPVTGVTGPPIEPPAGPTARVYVRSPVPCERVKGV